MTGRTAARALCPAAAAALLAGCAFTSPATTQLPYEPADGTNTAVGDVLLQNVLIVSEGEGEPGALVGRVANRGLEDAEVELSVTAEGSSFTETVSVPANTAVQLGPDGEEVVIDAVPAPLGALVPMEVRTASGGEELRVQVFEPSGPYEGYAPGGSGTDGEFGGDPGGVEEDAANSDDAEDAGEGDDATGGEDTRGGTGQGGD